MQPVVIKPYMVIYRVALFSITRPNKSLLLEDLPTCSQLTEVYVHLATFHIRQNASFSRSQPDFKGFLRALRFSPSTKLTPSLFQFDRMKDLPENHFRVSGASWVNIINFFFQYEIVATFCCCMRSLSAVLIS